MKINLLPETEKKEVKLEKVCQETVILLGLILIALLFFIFILISLKFYLTEKVNSLEEIVLERENELRTSQVLESKKRIVTLNQNLSKVQRFWQEELSIIPLFEKVISLTPQSIYFTGFSYQKRVQEEKKEKKVFAEIHISGWAETREELFNFKKELEKEKEFKEVRFAPTSWVKPTNLDFSLSLKFDPFHQIK